MKCCVPTDVGTWTNWLAFEPNRDHSLDPGTGFAPDFCISAFIGKSYGHIRRSYGRISMKFDGSIAAGTWTNWLGVEPDPDQSSDPETGFTPDFWISAGYLKKVWTDFREILDVDSCGVQRRRYMFLPVFVWLSVCYQDYSKMHAWIWIKCCVSTDVGTWTNWLTFEPDPDYSRDARTGLLHPISYKLCYAEFYVGKVPRIRIGGPALQRGLVLFTELWDNLCRRYMRSTECSSSCE